MITLLWSSHATQQALVMVGGIILLLELLATNQNDCLLVECSAALAIATSHGECRLCILRISSKVFSGDNMTCCNKHACIHAHTNDGSFTLLCRIDWISSDATVLCLNFNTIKSYVLVIFRKSYKIHVPSLPFCSGRDQWHSQTFCHARANRQWAMQHTYKCWDITKAF